MKQMILAANWKMHLGPTAARQFLSTFLAAYEAPADRQVWFFPSTVALEAVAAMLRDRPDIVVGAQNVYWEPEGAFTGELSVSMAREAGAGSSLVGHSERRHVFGETDEDTARKVRALLDGRLRAMLCVGETLEQRETNITLAVVERQLEVLRDLNASEWTRLVVAYEPVWAIGTGRTATPTDAAEVHAAIRQWLIAHGATPESTRVVYGGSVKPGNIAELLAEGEIDGVLVGGASLDPTQWAAMASTPVN